MPEIAFQPLVPVVSASLKPYLQMDKNQLNHLGSWVQRTKKAVYENCDLSNASLRGSRISNAIFNACSFNEADLSEAVFTKCVFQDCTFIRANLYKVTFEGCTLEASPDGDDSNFVGAGMGHIKFIPAKASRVHTSLRNLKFKQTGFRNGILSQCLIEGSTFSYVSFEDSLLDRCYFDSLNLVQCSCRAVRIKNCDIDFFKTTLDKLVSTIGIHNVLKNSRFEIVDYDDQGNLHNVTDIDEVFILIQNKMEQLVNNGKFFEVLNFIISFASQYGLERFMPSGQLEQLELPVNLPIDKTNHHIFYRDTDDSNFLYTRVARIIPLFLEHGVGISFDSLLYTLRLVSEYNISSPGLYKALLNLTDHLYRSQDRDYMDSPTIALVQYYLVEIAKNIPTGRIQICFTHPEIGYADTARRKEFFLNIDTLLEHALPRGKFDFERVVQGSLEHIISTIEYQQLLWFLLVVGIRFNIKRTREGNEFSFEFDGARAITSLSKLTTTGNKIIKMLGLESTNVADGRENDAKEVLRRGVDYNDSEYFKKNNVSGSFKRDSYEEKAKDEVARLTDSNQGATSALPLTPEEDESFK